MKDYIGQELKVGDKVVFVRQHYTFLAKGTIVSFTSKGAVVRFEDKHKDYYNSKDFYIKYSAQIIKVSKDAQDECS